MNKELIKDLAITGGIYDCLCDPYDKFKTGDDYGSVMWDLERFAEKIVLECCQKLEDDGMVEIAIEMKQHFGIEK